jgi:hypothetical protein
MRREKTLPKRKWFTCRGVSYKGYGNKGNTLKRKYKKEKYQYTS